MQRCSLLKEFGLTVTYDPANDKHREDTKKHHIHKAKKAAKKQAEKKDADGKTPTAEDKTIPSTLAQARGQATNPFTTVGPGGKATQTAGETKKVEPTYCEK